MRPLPLLLVLLASVSLQAQQVTTIAGIPGVAGQQDGAAAEATFNRPTWLDYDQTDGAIYVVDRENRGVRKVRSAQVWTVPFRENTFDRLAPPLSFEFGGPIGGGIAIEPPNAGCGSAMYAYGIFLSTTAQNRLAFVADFGWGAQYAARDNSSPLIGTGAPGASDGDQGRAQFNQPGDIALSWGYGGNYSSCATDRIYVADTGNHTIRRILCGISPEACPQPYFVETEAGIAGEAGADDGPPSLARFNAPRGLAAAPDGSIYVADTGNHTIRRIAADGVTTVAGKAGSPGWLDGPAGTSLLRSPTGIDVSDDGKVFFADSGNGVIRMLSLDGTLTTIAGTPGVGGWVDGSGRSARFNGPVGLRVVGQTIYVADTSNHVIRAIDLDAVPRRRSVRH